MGLNYRNAEAIKSEEHAKAPENPAVDSKVEESKDITEKAKDEKLKDKKKTSVEEKKKNDDKEPEVKVMVEDTSKVEVKNYITEMEVK